jgi:Tfp pilus assembly protein PilF
MGFGAMFLFRKPPDMDRAIKEFHRSLELQPNEPTIMATLVQAFVIKGDAKEAESMLTKLEKTAPAYDELEELKGKVAALVKEKTTAGKVQPANQ